MKKIFSLFAAILFAGSMWATEEVAYTLEVAATGGNSSPHNSYTAAATITISGIEWSVLGNSSMSPWRLGGKESNCSGADRDVHSNTAISDNISKIEITHGTAANITVNSMTVIVSKNADFSNPVSTLTPTFVASDVVTVNRPEGKDWTNCYFKFVYNLSVSGNSNRFVQFSGAVFYKEAGGTPTCATPSFSPKAGAVLSGTTVALSTTTEDADIYYTMGADPADPTSASTKYTAPISITEATTIKAIAIKDGYNNSGVASAAYTITTPLATMQAIFDAATSTATPTYITFSDSWVVTGVATNGKSVYITDGTKGMVLYNGAGNMGLVVGSTLSGTVQRSLKKYNGAAQLDGFTTDDLTVGTGSLPSVQELDAEGIAALGGVNTGSLIKISGACTVDNSKYYVAGVQLYNSLFAFTALTAGSNYNVTGVYAQYNSTKEIMPRSAGDIEEIKEEGAPETPTFSPAAGTYTSAQTVEISCATEGATIYYTTDGTTPDNTKTEYTSAISVGETMTIKAIAIKNDKSSSVATAAYTINLPENPEITWTWDLSTTSYVADPEPTADLIQWTSTYVTMKAEKNTGNTGVNNYIPPTRTSTRFYSGNKITFIPDGKKITTIVITAATSGYATAFKNATWTNATATANDTEVTVTASSTGNVVCVLGSNTGATAVTVNYEDIPSTPTISATPSSLDLGSIYKSSNREDAKKTFTLTGSNLTNQVKLLSSGAAVDFDRSEFVDPTDGAINVEVGVYPYSTDEEGEFSATISVKGTGENPDGIDEEIVTVTWKVVPAPVPTGQFELCAGAITAGKYLITYDNAAMNTTVSSNRLQYDDITLVGNTVINPDSALVWTIAKSGDYWTLYSEKAKAYAASTGAANKLQLLADGTDDKALWTITVDESVYEFVNKANAASEVNSYLRKNGSYGFACYASGTGGALTLYRRTGWATSVDNTDATNKAVKFIENGQLFIELNGRIYNVQGQTVK